MRLPMTDLEKAQAIADKLYSIAPSRNTIAVTADRIKTMGNVKGE